MKWSLLAGKFWGTEIRLHVSLLLLVPYALLAFKPVGLADMLRVLALIAAVFVFVALHEIGHTLAARLYGIQVDSIVLWPLGGFANLSRRPDKVLPDLVISAAGPLTNLLLSIGLGALTVMVYLAESSQIFPMIVRPLEQWRVFSFLAGMTVANLSLALFNLVPIYPLDGGQILRGLLKMAFGEKNADRIMLVFSLPLALALAFAGLITRDVIILLTGLVMVFAAITLNPRLLNGLILAGLYLVDRAGYYLKRADFDPAVREYTRAIQRWPNRTGLYVSRAVAYMNLMQGVQAMADVNHALECDAENHVAWALRGELLSLQKDDAGAMDAYNHAIQLQPSWAIAYLDRGGRYQERGDMASALEDMNRAVELGRGSPVTYLLRSLLHYQMGNMDGFRADADQALRFAPQWMLAFPELFLTNLEGHLDWALAYYGRAIERMPNAYQAYQGRADACRANKRPDWAITDYHYAIHLAPRQAELYLGRGLASLQANQISPGTAATVVAAAAVAAEAEADFRQAAKLADRAHIRRRAEALLNRNAGSSAGSPAAAQSEPAA